MNLDVNDFFKQFFDEKVEFNKILDEEIEYKRNKIKRSVIEVVDYPDFEVNAPEMRYLAEVSKKSHFNKILEKIKKHSECGEVSCPYTYKSCSDEDFAFLKNQLSSLGFKCARQKCSNSELYIWWYDAPKKWWKFWKR